MSDVKHIISAAGTFCVRLHNHDLANKHLNNSKSQINQIKT